MSIDPKILEKIKKLKAKGEGVGPEEAALFMNKVNQMMDDLGISETDIHLTDFGHTRYKSNLGVSRENRYENRLLHTVAKAFGCTLLYHAARSHFLDNKAEYSFIGRKDRAELASYTATVLARKLSKARQTYIKTVPEWYSRSEKTAAANGFCLGWVEEIAKTVHGFAGTPQDLELIDAYQLKTFGEITKESKSKKLGWHRDGLEAGRRAAKDESLHRPMNERDRDTMIERRLYLEGRK